MKKRLVAIDLDGTLLNDHGEIDSYSSEMIAHATNNNIEIVISTGRAISEIQSNVLQLPIKYFACSNGAFLWDNHRKIIIERNYLTKDEINECLNSLSQINKVITMISYGEIFSGSNIYETLSEEDIMNGVMQRFLETRTITDDFDVLIDHGIEKLHLNFYDTICRNNAIQEIAKIKTINYSYTDDVNLEIYNKNCSKGMAIKRIKALDENDFVVYAIGDSDNDISMFEQADLSIAMKNASANLKEQATYEAKWSNNDNGVGNILNEIVSDRI